MCDGCVQMLRLSSAQEEQLLQLRKKHLRNLRNLYEDRQRLNLGVSQFRLTVAMFNRLRLVLLYSFLMAQGCVVCSAR